MQGHSSGGKSRRRGTRSASGGSRGTQRELLLRGAAGSGALALPNAAPRASRQGADAARRDGDIPAAPPVLADAVADTSPVDELPSPTALPPAVERTPLPANLPSLRELGAQRLRDFWDYVRSLTPETWVWIAVLTLATVLRFWALGAKPLHHDESMHAYFSLQFAHDPASYSYNPLLHGPFQFHAEGIVFAILLALEHLLLQAQAWGDPWITDATARILPAAFGVGIVALPIWLRREMGRAGALMAAFLLAVSPAFVYFSRFLREDIYFNFFMFAMVVAAVNFARTRAMRWLLALAAATVLAYATFEGTYLTLVIFLSFLALLAVWELGHRIADLLPAEFSMRERVFFSRAGLLLILGAIASVIGLVGLNQLNQISAYINSHPNQSAAQVQQLENTTVAVLLYASIVIALVVIGTLVWQMYRDDSAFAGIERSSDGPVTIDDVSDDELHAAPLDSKVARLDRVFRAPGRAKARLRDQLDPVNQRFLRLLLGISWVQWFVAFVAGWMIFAALYWVLPGDGHNLGQGFQQGIGSGIWQGLYYWLQQQHVARGGQPYYYYLLLLPLYEQLACVFAIAGSVYALARPTRFRLFLVWWFVLSLGIYSWAGEKMPWLSIHILLPMMLLSGIVIAAALRTCVELARHVAANGRLPRSRAGVRYVAGALGVVTAAVLLIPMIHSMLTLAYTNPANGPYEMMVYVQTTPDVDTVMAKIDALDTKLYHGQHLLRIGVGPGEEWPFWWYLRDYHNAYFEYNPTQANAPKVDAMILLPAGADGSADAATFLTAHTTGYRSHQYALRSWWDEAYKPAPCVATKGHPCASSPSDQWGYGVGLGPYLSYGSNPPAHATFNAGRAANRLWNWLWLRKPLGYVGPTNAYYDFTFIVPANSPVQP